MSPNRSKRPCLRPGCPELVEKGYCDKHKKSKRKESDAQRGTSSQRGYDYRWQKYRKFYLQRNPLCVRCEKKDRLEPAAVVDHIIPHKGNYDLFWDEKNHQPLCKRCHDKKTATEDSKR